MASTRRILIIGSGFGGLGLAIRLKRAGIETFTILEKAATLGGTWRDNTYPGAACDVPSMLYSFSFEPKTDWTRKWSGQAEIHAYMEECARRNDLLRHIRFGVEVASARFDEASGTWTVRTRRGEEHRRRRARERRRPAAPAADRRPSPASRASAARASTRRAGTTTSTSPASASA